MTTLTETTVPYTPEIAIEQLHESLECIAADLNDAIVELLGDRAAWENHVGLDPQRNGWEFRLFYQGQWSIIYQEGRWARNGQALLQAALQEAIRERGWRFTFFWNDKTYTVDVFTTVFNVFDDDALVYTYEGLVPAIALLQAFLKAMEAQS